MQQGYVYILPCGNYVREGLSNGHGPTRATFSKCSLNQATVFPTPRLTGMAVRAREFTKNVPNYQAIAATATRVVTLL